MKILSSPNYNKRPADTTIDTLVIHYTGMKSSEDAIKHLCNSKAKVSCHYVIDEDGEIFQLVEERYRAWHAGVSYWRGRDNINNFSIGIELINPGHEFGYRHFPEKQIKSLIELCKLILKRNIHIEPRNIVGHSDIAPLRKEDPGELFNWKILAKNGIGLWPDANIFPKKNEILVIQEKLSSYGYKVNLDGNYTEETKKVIIAFQRHFVQDKLDGIWGVEEQAKLDWLLSSTEKLSFQKPVCS